MAVLPGSLDYLYYNGIIDHIPYEAYTMPPMAGAYGQYPQYMNGSQYLNAARQGLNYNTYTGDSFARANYYDAENQGKGFRQSIMDAANSTKEKISGAPNFIKGLLGVGIVAGTLFCLFKGKKAPAQTVPPANSPATTSFWSKINPLNWLKK